GDAITDRPADTTPAGRNQVRASTWWPVCAGRSPAFATRLHLEAYRREPLRLPQGTVMTRYRAWAAPTAGAPLEPFEYDPGPLGAEDVEITVEHCGVCHSDLSMLDNEWGFTQYAFVPGYEAVGRV